jgi:hypothetical protein
VVSDFDEPSGPVNRQEQIGQEQQAGKDDAARREQQNAALSSPRGSSVDLSRPTWLARPIVRWGRHRLLTWWILITLPLALLPLFVRNMKNGHEVPIPLAMRLAFAVLILSWASPAFWTLVGKAWQLVVKLATVALLVGVVMLVTHMWGVTLFGHHFGK